MEIGKSEEKERLFRKSFSSRQRVIQNLAIYYLEKKVRLVRK